MGLHGKEETLLDQEDMVSNSWDMDVVNQVFSSYVVVGQGFLFRWKTPAVARS